MEYFFPDLDEEKDNELFCENLNKLNEENKRLEKELTKTSMDYYGLSGECEGLVAENKDLKMQIDEKDDLLEAYGLAFEEVTKILKKRND